MTSPAGSGTDNEISSIDELRALVDRVAAAWAPHTLQRNKRATPGSLFVNTWTPENASYVSKTPRVLKVILLGGPLLVAIVAPIMAFPAGLAVTATYAVVLLPIVALVRHQDAQLARDQALMASILPQMQQDYLEIIDETRAVASGLQSELMAHDADDQELSEAIGDVREVLVGFVEGVLGVRVELITAHPVREPEPHHDYTAANLARQLLLELDALARRPTVVNPEADGVPERTVD